MPEIKNQFTSGKMNKDHDERLIPNGEYRDALNIDILTSEGSDVGSAQNSLGNSVVSTLGQAGNVCVGVCKYGRADKILWLIAGTTVNDTKVDLIAEYNVDGELVKPVVVDAYQWKGVVSSASQGSTTVTLNGSVSTYNIRTGMTFTVGSTVHTINAINGQALTVSPALASNISSGTTITFHAERVLNFSASRYITGLNVLDGFLYWTDNDSEPKKIHIKRCASATIDALSHTKLVIDGSDLGFIKEQDITVIKKYPLNAPTLTMASSVGGGIISASLVTEANTFNYKDAIGGSVLPVPSGTQHNANTLEANGDIIYDYITGSQVALRLPGSGFVFSPAPDAWEVGSQIKLTAEIDNVDYEVRLQLDQLMSTTSTGLTFATSVLSISSGLPNVTITWTAVLEQEDALYELVFPRFAYRWKYVDGEYSVISPFSTVAFLPEKEIGFDYEPEKGYNTAMVNQLRDLTINGFDEKPLDAVEVDILYKESNNTNIYVIETLKENEQTFRVKNEISQGILPSNQILRPYDNVPRYAKAQEISANRLIYGNYTQQYDVDEDPSFGLSLLSTEIAPAIPEPSLKSIRTYQVGVVYLDKYGRQTPVFSSESASLTIPQVDASKQNKLKVRLTSNAPSWATHAKFFVKEPSTEYYNIAMDRWYDAEDGNVWISFPSSERNKLAVDDFLILKKEHSSDIPVSQSSGGTVKYKVLALENSAPDFLKKQKNTIGKITTQFGRGQDATDGFPVEDILRIVIPGADIANSSLSEIASTTIANKYFRILSSSGNVSEWYAVDSVSRVDVGSDGDYDGSNDYYVVTSKKPMSQDITFTGTGSAKLTGLSFEWAEEDVDLYNSEYAGRFFVKIYKDSILEDTILDDDNNSDYGIIYNEKIYFLTTGSNNRDHYKGYQKWAIDTREADKGSGMTMVNPRIGEGIKRGSKKLDLTIWNWGDDEEFPAWKYPSRTDLSGSDTYYDIYQRLRRPGTYLRWTDDPDQTVYKIRQSNTEYILNYHDSYFWHDNWDEWASNHAIRMKITLDKASYWDPTRSGQFGGVTPTDSDSLNSSGANAYPLTNHHGGSRNSYTRLQFLKKVNDGITYASENPAIFETEPKERADLNLYYETSKTYTIAELANTNSDGGWRTLDYFNCYSFGNGVESNRIRDDFNAVTIDKGPKVSTVLAEQYKTENKQNSMIWSGIYNSSSSVNRTNEFIQAEAITKDLNPSYGSIQKMFTRRGDVVVFCEDKTLKVLSNKDALFNADGSSNLLASSKVLGQSIPFQGEYGISRNPESFANFAFRIYYTDKNRNAVLRLSGDGIEELTRYGMKDYFKDSFNSIGSNKIIGSYDMDKNNYNLTLGSETISFTELTKGWTSRKSFIQENGISLNGKYYTFKNGEIWEHNSNALRNNFYGTQYNSTIKFIFNEAPSVVKNFKTINYEGTQSKIIQNTGDYRYDNEASISGWECTSIETDQQSGHVTEFLNKEGKWFNYIKGVTTTWNNVQHRGNLDTAEFSSQGIGNIASFTDDAPQTQFTLTIVENND